MKGAAARMPLVQSARIAWFALLALAVYLVASALSWRGLGDWDGVHYVRGALLWIENGPSLGRDHWELRHPLVLPMAFSMEAAGRSELAASLPNLVYGAMLVVVSVVFAERLMPRAGLFLGVLVATSPALALLPLEVEIRGPEIFFSVLSLWLLVEGVSREGPLGAWFLLFAGLASGLAWMCREVAGYLPPVLVAAGWLLAPSGRRFASALLPAMGFAAAIVFELTLYGVAAGDPLYRYRTDLGHGGGRVGTEFAGTITQQNDIAGILHDALNPLVLRASEVTTGPFFIAGLLAALVVVVFRDSLSGTARRTVALFAAASVVSYALATLILNLETPRYFPMLDYCALVLMAVAAAVAAARGQSAVAAALIGGVSLAGVFITDFKKDYEFDACRAAAVVAMEHDEPVVTSTWIRERAEIVLRLQGMTAADAAAEFADLSEARTGYIGFMPSPRRLAPKDFFDRDWEMIGETPVPRMSWSHWLVSHISAVVPLPEKLGGKPPPQSGMIYRLGEAPR